MIDEVINVDLTHDQLANKYKKAHVFVISSRSEGFPLTLLEACASKTPVVATSVGEIPSIIKNRETGLLVEPENPHALGAAVVELLSNKNLSNKLAKRGYTLVNKNYSWDTVAKETRHVYEGIT